MTPIAPKGPKAEANRLSTLLAYRYGSDRFPVDVHQLAIDYAEQFGQEDPIARIVGEDLPGFEGGLYGSVEDGHLRWSIIYNSTVQTPGRIRFTLAHELGHYILHRRQRDSFECSQDDMLRWEAGNNRLEEEADTFASYLLMPIDDFRAILGNEAVNLERLGECAARYGVSLTAAILKWLEFTHQRAVLVVSVDGYILWARSSQSAFKSGAFFKTKGRVVPVPEGSLATSDTTISSERQGVELPAHIWFPKEPKDMPLREMKIVSDRYKQTMTLLILSSSEPRIMQRNNELRDTDDEHLDGLDAYIQSGFMSQCK